MKFLNKKGDLNLSINAIVVLIIAIVFLGLALTFTRNIIMGSSDKLISGVDNVDLQNPADAEHPITTDSKFEIKAGGQKKMKFSVYNTNTIPAATTVQPWITGCVGGPASATLPAVTVSAIETGLPSNQPVGFQTIVSVQSGATAGEYICKVVVADSATATPSITMQIPFTVTG